MHKFTRSAQFAAWASISLISYLTLAHVGLVYSVYFKLSPLLLNIGMKKYVVVEHFAAFTLFGALFCSTYPKRTLMVFFVVFGSAIALELMQTLTPDRHATFVDAIEKLAGGACGIFVTKAALNFWQRPPVQLDAI